MKIAINDVWHNGIATTVEVKVVPGASSTEIAGLLGDKLKVRLGAVAEKGKANRALTELLARSLGTGKNHVQVVSGHTSSLKQVRITGLTARQVRRKLGLEQQVDDG